MTNKFYLKSLDIIKKGKLAEAILFLDKAIEEEPKNAIYYSERGICYLNLNKLERALEDLNTSVDLDPEYAYRYSVRALVKDKMGDTKGGIEDYQIAVNLDPDDPISFNNLGMLLEKLGYQKSSKRNFEIADELTQKKEEVKEVTPIKSNSLPPIKNQIEKETDKTIGSVFKNLFNDKNTREEFVQFIKNGLKIKK